MCVPSGHTDWGRQKNLYVYHALSHALAPWTRGIFFRKKPREKVIGNYGMTFRIGVTDYLSAS